MLSKQYFYCGFYTNIKSGKYRRMNMWNYSVEVCHYSRIIFRISLLTIKIYMVIVHSRHSSLYTRWMKFPHRNQTIIVGHRRAVFHDNMWLQRGGIWYAILFHCLHNREVISQTCLLPNIKQISPTGKTLMGYNIIMDLTKGIPTTTQQLRNHFLPMGKMLVEQFHFYSGPSSTLRLSS